MVWFACLNSRVFADVWEYRVDGAVVVHQAIHYQRRGWKPVSVVVMARYRARYEELINSTANRHSVDPILVHAVIEVESAYDARAVSKKGALGLMQLMPETARRYAIEDALDPAQNVEGGVRYLKDLIGQFGQLDLVLAAYNAGEDAVERYQRSVPPYAETIQYVDRLLQLIDERSGVAQSDD